MYVYQGKTALITGASSGIGEAFALQLASRGMNTLLVARSAEKLQKLSAEIMRIYGVHAESIVCDLSQPEATQKLYQTVLEKGFTVDLLINNAGFGTHGSFEGQLASREREEVLLNVAAVVDLSHAFLPAMVARGEGAIINVASTAAFQPVPYMAVYGATKAFVLSFSQALWAEYRQRNIRVLALCPGPTSTNFFEVVGTDDAAVGSMREPEMVVDVALRALERKRSLVIDGLQNFFLAQSARLLPRSTLALLVERMMRPKSEEFSSPSITLNSTASTRS